MLAGSLTEFGLADVFSLLATTRKTGVLNLEGPSSRGRVWIADGGLCHAVSDVRRAPLAARLLHGAEATDEQAEALVAAQADGDAAAIAAALEAIGLTHERVQRLVVDQVTDAVFDLSRWDDGTFAFDNRDGNGATPVTSAADVLATVQQRLAEWDGILARVPSGQTVLELVSRPSVGADQTVSVQAPHWEVLTLIDGLRSIGEIIDVTGQGTFVVSRLLADLIDAGLVGEVAVSSVHTASERRHRAIADAEQRLLGAAEGVVRHERPISVAAPFKVETPEPDIHAHDDDVDVHADTGEHDAPASDYAIDPRSLLNESYGASEADGASSNPWDAAVHDQHDETVVDEVPVHDERRVDEAVHGDDTSEHREAARDLSADPGRPTDAPASAVDSTDQRRARELAALGIGPAPTTQDAPDEPAKPLQRDSSVNADLLARLIDGVKSV